MKTPALGAVLLTLCACSTPSAPMLDNASAEGAAVVTVSATAIRAFQDICLKTAPSFAGASVAAKNYGVARMDNMGVINVGFNNDRGLSVQVQPNKECAVTTPSTTDTSLTTQFIRAVSVATDLAPLPRSAPFRARLGKEKYFFHHDRNGSEAYVMLRADL